MPGRRTLWLLGPGWLAWNEEYKSLRPLFLLPLLNNEDDYDA